MKLFEIDGSVRKLKRSIDRMFVKYTATHDNDLHMQIIDSMDAIYPTGYLGIDASLTECKQCLTYDLLDLLAGKLTN